MVVYTAAEVQSQGATEQVSVQIKMPVPATLFSKP